MTVINVWDLVPFPLDVGDHPHYETLKSLIRENGVRTMIIVERVGDQYRLVSSRWTVIAARAVGVYQIEVYVSQNPCGEIALEGELCAADQHMGH